MLHTKTRYKLFRTTMATSPANSFASTSSTSSSPHVRPTPFERLSTWYQGMSAAARSLHFPLKWRSSPIIDTADAATSAEMHNEEEMEVIDPSSDMPDLDGLPKDGTISFQPEQESLLFMPDDCDLRLLRLLAQWHVLVQRIFFARLGLYTTYTHQLPTEDIHRQVDEIIPSMGLILLLLASILLMLYSVLFWPFHTSHVSLPVHHHI